MHGVPYKNILGRPFLRVKAGQRLISKVLKFEPNDKSDNSSQNLFITEQKKRIEFLTKNNPGRHFLRVEGELRVMLKVLKF